MKKTAKKIMALVLGVMMGLCMQFSALASENPFTVNDTDISVGSTEITVRISAAEATGLDAYHFWVGYDTSVLKVKDDAAYAYTQQFLDAYKGAPEAMTALNAVDGKVIFAGANPEQNSYSGDIATITFSILADTTTAAEAITALTFHLEALTSHGVDSETGQDTSYQINVVEADTYISGDVDGNGSVELSDAQLALKAALGIISLDEQAFIRADVDNNKSIELSDAQTILKKALKIIA